MCAKDEALARAQAHGLKWAVLDHRVVDRWPDIVQYGIAVMNARSSAEISETEGMLAIYEAVEAELMANKEINWEFALRVRFLLTRSKTEKTRFHVSEHGDCIYYNHNKPFIVL